MVRLAELLRAPAVEEGMASVVDLHVLVEALLGHRRHRFGLLVLVAVSVVLDAYTEHWEVSTGHAHGRRY